MKINETLNTQAIILNLLTTIKLYKIEGRSKESFKKNLQEENVPSLDNLDKRWKFVLNDIKDIDPGNPAIGKDHFFLNTKHPRLYQYLFNNLNESSSVDKKSQKYNIKVLNPVSFYDIINRWKKNPFCQENQYGMNLSTIKSFLHIFDDELYHISSNSTLDQIINFHLTDSLFNPYLFSKILDSIYEHESNSIHPYHIKNYVYICTALQHLPSTELKMYYFNQLNTEYWYTISHLEDKNIYEDTMTEYCQKILDNIFAMCESYYTELENCYSSLRNSLPTFSSELSIETLEKTVDFKINPLTLIKDFDSTKFHFFDKTLKESLAVNISHIFYHSYYPAYSLPNPFSKVKTILYSDLGMNNEILHNHFFPYNDCYLSYLQYKNK